MEPPVPRVEKGLRQLTTTVPSIDINQLRKAAAGGGCSIVWRNGAGIECYFARVDFREDEVQIRSGFDAADEEFATVRWSYGGGETFANCTFECPHCRKRFKVIYYHRISWRCRKCHGLGYPSQYQSGVGQLLDKLSAMKAEVASGRPKYMRLEKYQRKLQLIAELTDALQPELSDKSKKGIYHRSLTALYSTKRVDMG